MTDNTLYFVKLKQNLRNNELKNVDKAQKLEYYFLINTM